MRQRRESGAAFLILYGCVQKVKLIYIFMACRCFLSVTFTEECIVHFWSDGDLIVVPNVPN